MEKTINEARADYGLPPIDNGDAVMITTSMKADSPSRCLIDTTDGTACSHPSLRGIEKRTTDYTDRTD